MIFSFLWLEPWACLMNTFFLLFFLAIGQPGMQIDCYCCCPLPLFVSLPLPLQPINTRYIFARHLGSCHKVDCWFFHSLFLQLLHSILPAYPCCTGWLLICCCFLPLYLIVVFVHFLSLMWFPPFFAWLLCLTQLDWCKVFSFLFCLAIGCPMHRLIVITSCPLLLCVFPAPATPAHQLKVHIFWILLQPLDFAIDFLCSLGIPSSPNSHAAQADYWSVVVVIQFFLATNTISPLFCLATSPHLVWLMQGSFLLVLDRCTPQGWLLFFLLHFAAACTFGTHATSRKACKVTYFVIVQSCTEIDWLFLSCCHVLQLMQWSFFAIQVHPPKAGKLFFHHGAWTPSRLTNER